MTLQEIEFGLVNRTPPVDMNLFDSRQVDSAVSTGDYKSWRDQNKSMLADDANLLNAWMAERANMFNAQQWKATNEWNLAQWERENEYNSPAQQMKRFADAGINPIFALGGSDPGQSQHLTADIPHPTVLPNMSYEPQRLANEMLQFSQTNGLNSALGFGELDLKNRNYYLTARRTKSEIKKTQAETDLLKSQLESNEFVNKVNSATFSTQVNLKIEELNQVRQNIKNLKSQQSLSDAQQSLLEVTEDKEKALKLQIEAATDKVKSETFDKLDNLRFRWYEARTGRMSAQASQTSAEASVMMAENADKALSHQIEKDTKELERYSNDQILHIIETQRGWLDRMLGTPFNALSGISGNKDNEMVDRVVSVVQAASSVLFDRFYNNPTQTNEKAVKEMLQRIEEFQKLHIPIPVQVPQSSVLNPSQ